MFTIGTFLLIILLANGLKKDKALVKDSRKDYFMYVFKVLIVFSLYINIGYFFKIGSFELAYAEILTFFFLLIGLFIIKQIRISIPSVLILISFVLTITLGYWFLLSDASPALVLPVGRSWDNVFYGYENLVGSSFSGAHIKRFVRIILFIGVYFIVDKYFIKNDERTSEIKRFVVRGATVFACVGVIEQLTRIVFSSDIVIRTARNIFGHASSQLSMKLVRGDLPALQGFMLEPGHYAQAFLPAIVILFTSSIFTEKQRFRLFALFAYVLFFSGSFTGFAVLVFMVTLYMFSHRKKIFIKLCTVFLLTISSVIFVNLINSPLLDYYLVRVNSVLTGESVAGNSDGVRLLSINNTMNTFYDNPVFGIGFGTTDALGFIPTMLVNVGILGTSFWFIIMLRGFTKTKITNIYALLFLLPVLFFIGDTGTFYSVNMLLVFCFVFRKSIVVEENILVKKFVFDSSQKRIIAAQ